MMPFTAYCDSELPSFEQETLDDENEDEKIDIKRIVICLMLICGIILTTYYFTNGFDDLFETIYDSDSDSSVGEVEPKKSAEYNPGRYCAPYEVNNAHSYR